MRSDSVHMRRTLFRRTLFRRTLFLAALLVDHAHAWRPADRTAPPPPADLHCQSWCTQYTMDQEWCMDCVCETASVV